MNSVSAYLPSFAVKHFQGALLEPTVMYTTTLASEYSEPTKSILPSVCASSALRQAVMAALLTLGEKPTFGIGEAGCCRADCGA